MPALSRQPEESSITVAADAIILPQEVDMTMRSSILRCLLPIALVAVTVPAQADDVALPDEVRLLLERHCVECHNDNDRSGDLSLQSRAAALAGGVGGPAWTPGNADGSLLMSYVTPVVGAAEMPKDRPPLTDDELSALNDWINSVRRGPTMSC